MVRKPIQESAIIENVRAGQAPGAPDPTKDELRQRRASETREAEATRPDDKCHNEGPSVCNLRGPAIGARSKYSLVKRFVRNAALLYALAAVAFFVYRDVELSPVCSLPGIRVLSLHSCKKPSGGWKDELNGASDFSRLVKLQSGFEGVLESSSGGSSLATDLRGSEIVVKELGKLVRSSGLACKQALSNALGELSDTAISAGEGLMRFDSRVNGIVDYLISIDQYVIRALSAARTQHLKPSYGNILNFRPSHDAATKEKDVRATFIKATSIMDTSIRELVREGEQVLRDLYQLENQLGVITEITSAEKERLGTVVKRLDDWARRLSPYFGRQTDEAEKKRRKYDAQYALLANVVEVSDKAIDHVDTAVIKLRQMQAQLDDLRDRVVKPALLDDAGIEDIPLEIHLENIMMGVERLTMGKIKAQEIDKEARKRMVEMRAKVSNHG